MNAKVRILIVTGLLLCITAFFWVTLALFHFAVADIFHRHLMKRLGPIVVWSTMAGCPLLAALLGQRMTRKHGLRFVGGLSSFVGGAFFVMFVVFVAIPLAVKHATRVETPKNPTTPRNIEPQVGLPVFPGAEGFGTRTPAGRGGKVIEVTSLDDDGSGTLRAALNDPSPRTIVFRVSGTIELQDSLYISHPLVTVAGQTAPGDGICLKNCGLVILTHDVLIQHLRVRPGNKGRIAADVNDAITILGKHGEIAGGAHHVVIDHVSASWGEDETISTWYGAHNITISWCIISEALNKSRHRKRRHSAGLLIGDSSEHVTVHHCLLAHNDFRNPLISSGGTHDIVNNVVYDWGVLPAEIVDTDGNSFLNFVGNYFLPGPSTQSGNYEIVLAGGNPKIFVRDNLGPHRLDAAADDWSLVGFGYGDQGVAPPAYRAAAPFVVHPVTSSTADEALKQVLAGAGATRPRRDAVDQRIIAQVRTKTGRIVNSPGDVGGFPTLTGATPPLDSDRDGLPDYWERSAGLDPNDELDAGADQDGDGYTNIEEYLHSLIERPPAGRRE